MHGRVVTTERLTPGLMRVTLGGGDLEHLTMPDATDSYVNAAFRPAGATYDEVFDPQAVRDTHPDQPQPARRRYTVRAWDAAAHLLTIDFVVHGDEGVAGPWAAAAAPGDVLVFTGPSGGYRPEPTADWHLFAGDEAAVPAIGAALEALPDNAIGQAFIEVAGPEDEIALTAPSGVEVRWIYRGGRADLVPEDQAGDNAPLIAAVKEAAWLPGQVQVFIHGEAQTVMHNLRPYIRKERGVDAKWAGSISGYWRRGRTEETFRQWKRELAEAEATA